VDFYIIMEKGPKRQSPHNGLRLLNVENVNNSN